MKVSKNLGQSSSSVWFLLLSVASVTLFINIDLYDPFNSAKLLLLLVLDGWIIGHLANSYRNKPIKFRSTEFISTTIFFLFLICLSISTFLTDALIVGFIGETQRRNGFLSYLGLGVIFLFAVRSMDFYNILRVYKIGIITGVILSTYGLIQISGRDFIAWDNPYSSMISTLGNPNFASALLALMLLLGLYGSVLKNLSIIFKLLSIYLFSSALVAIIISGSRQGLLVIFFSLIFYLSIYSYLKNKKIGIIISSICGTGAALALLGMLQIGPLTNLLYKDSISVRGYYWRAGIEMFKDSPLIGVGVDRYAVFFKEFREVSYGFKYGYEITSSNAHNTFIQLFATAGIFVGISYLILIALIFISGINLLRNSQPGDQKIILGLLATWVGFQAQSLISIDNIGISIWGWLLGGSILGLKKSSEEKLEQSGINKVPVRRSNQIKINLFQPTISIVVLVPILIFVTAVYKVENNLWILKNISDPARPENKEPVLQYAKKVLDSPVADPFYKYKSTLFLYDMGYQDESYKFFLDLLVNDPINPDLMRGKVFFETARKNITGIISAREQISAVDPWNADNYLELLKLYKNNDDINNATLMKNKILSFASGTEIAKTALEILE